MSSVSIRFIVLISYTLGNIALFLIDGGKNPELYWAMRAVGQMALPLVCFLTVEGFLRTSNRKFYFLRLFAFGFAAEVPFSALSMGVSNRILGLIHSFLGEDAAFSADNVNELSAHLSDAAYRYNVESFESTANYIVDGMMTVAMSLLFVALLEKISKKYYKVKPFAYYSLNVLTMFAAIFFLNLIYFEMPIQIFFFICIFFYLRGNKPGVAVMGLMMIVMFYLNYSVAFAVAVAAALLIILSYNGKEGELAYLKGSVDEKKDKPVKKANKAKKAKAENKSKANGDGEAKRKNLFLRYFFYAYYPVHMIVLYYIAKAI